MVDDIPIRPRKGRGAVTNPTGRFERHVREDFDDGWTTDEELPPLRTTVAEDATRRILTTNDSPDIGFNQSINPYKGCEHGCIYCFARPTHAYLGLSPGLDFETKLFAKSNAAELLEAELSKPGYRPQATTLGANTDPYQPIERERQITQRVLETMARFEHPVSIITKSALVVRDLDILASMAERRLVSVAITVTTLDRDLARTLEPRAETPPKRLEAIRRLSEAGVPVAVIVAPIIPFLTDSEMETIVETAKDAGAASAAYVLLRLPHELKDLFTEWLETHHPGKAKHVLSLLRSTRNGSLYVSELGSRMRGTGAYADLISRRFKLVIARLGLMEGRVERFRLDYGRFRVPPKPGDQLTLL